MNITDVIKIAKEAGFEMGGKQGNTIIAPTTNELYNGTHSVIDELIKFAELIRVNGQEPFGYVLAINGDLVFKKTLDENEALVYSTISVYTSPQPAIHTDNSAAIAAMQAKLDKAIKALESLAGNRTTVGWVGEIIDTLCDYDDSFVIKQVRTLGMAKQEAEQALNELSQ